MSNLKLLFCAFALLISLTGIELAQQANATLSGVVTDPNGAVIPNSAVTVTSKSKNFARTTVTNNESLYVIANLPPDEYEVKISASGFESKLSASPVALKVGQTVTLNAKLKIGQFTTNTDLTGEMPRIDTQTSKVDAVIDSREIMAVFVWNRHWKYSIYLTSPTF